VTVKLEHRIQKRRHAVIVVAEGAGQAIASGGPLYCRRPAKQRGSSRPLIMPILISDFDGTITQKDVLDELIRGFAGWSSFRKGRVGRFLVIGRPPYFR